MFARDTTGQNLPGTRSIISCTVMWEDLSPITSQMKIYRITTCRAVDPQEIFPNRQLTQGIFYEQIFDVAYYPTERGPYNYNPSLDNNGFLTNPETNWAGITNAIRTEVDFDKANIEYVEFWLLDPFINTPYGYIDDGIHPT